MGDIKLFRLNQDTVDELEGQSVAVEKSLQHSSERHNERFLLTVLDQFKKGKSTFVNPERVSWPQVKCISCIMNR